MEIPIARRAVLNRLIVITAAITLSPIIARGAMAQEGSIVGVWMRTTVDQNGRPVASFTIEFQADGTTHMQILVANGMVDYYGTYQVQGSTLQTVYDDYEPKESCNGVVCLAHPSALPIGQVITNTIRFPDANTLVIGTDIMYRAS